MYPPPHVIPSPTRGHSTWSGIIKPMDSPLHAIDSQQSFSVSSSTKNIKQFSFLQDDSSRFSRPAFQPMMKATSPAESGSSSSSKVLAGGVPAQVFDSDCALSLLSAAQENEGIGVGVGQLLPAGRIPVHRPLVSDLAYATATARPSSYASAQPAFSCFGDPEGNVFVCEAEAGLQCQCVFNAMSGGGSSGEASQALPFPWQ